MAALPGQGYGTTAAGNTCQSKDGSEMSTCEGLHIHGAASPRAGPPGLQSQRVAVHQPAGLAREGLD
jgi:hypothetical protein